MNRWMAAALLAATTLPSTALAAPVLVAAQQGAVEVGDAPQYKFREALVNGQGTGSLADLQGRPVLVEFWGTR